MLSPELRFRGLLKLGKQKPRQTQSYGLGGTCAGSWARCLLAVWAVSSSCHLILFPQEKTKDFEMFSEMSPHLRSATRPKHSMVWHLLSCHPTSGPSDRILRQLESPARVSQPGSRFTSETVASGGACGRTPGPQALRWGPPLFPLRNVSFQEKQGNLKRQAGSGPQPPASDPPRSAHGQPATLPKVCSE